MTAASTQSVAVSDGQSETPAKAAIDDHNGALSGIAPFQDLPDAVLSLLCEHSEQRQYSAGQTVFPLGQYDGGEFLVVLSGELRASIADGATGAMMIEQVPAKGVFGLEIAMSEPDPELFQQIAVTAEKDSNLIVIDAAEFKSIAAGRPSLMRNVAINMAQQLFAQRFRALTPQTAPDRRSAGSPVRPESDIRARCGASPGYARRPFPATKTPCRGTRLRWTPITRMRASAARGRFCRPNARSFLAWR